MAPGISPYMGQVASISVGNYPSATDGCQTQKAKGIMPGRKGLKGATKKEKRMYEKIKKKAQSSGRYGKRAKEVAARTVMKRHSKKKKS